MTSPPNALDSSCLLPASAGTPGRLRLVCFPHAGGGTSLFYRWRSHLPADVPLVPLRLPGREERLAEPPYTCLQELAEHAATAIRSLPAGPVVLVGHSLGAYVAFETARRLTTAGSPPRALVVAAASAPFRRSQSAHLADLSDADFLAEIQHRYDGIPATIAAEPELLRLVLPTLRADMKLVENYTYQASPPLPCELLALGGSDDPAVSSAALSDWRRETSASFESRRFAGGHFFWFPESRRQGAAAAPAALSWLVTKLQSWMNKA